MSRVQTITLPKIGKINILVKTKRDIPAEVPVEKRDGESLGWGYWDRIWPSSVALSRHLVYQFFPTKLAGMRVLEIGCGTGLPGVVAANLGAFTMFSDMVPLTLQAVQETCQLNGIRNYATCTLDWSDRKKFDKRYDLVLGSEVFYDENILPEISFLLEQMLAKGGKALFCDPNRLGLDTIERAFHPKFSLAVEPIALNWLPQHVPGQEKKVYVYELTSR